MLGALVLVPVVVAADRPDDRADRTSVGVTAAEEGAWAPLGTADTVEARIRSGLDASGSVLAAVRPDDRSGALGIGSVATATRPDDRAGARGVGAVEASRPRPVPTAGTADPTDPRLVLGVGLTIAGLCVAAFVLVEQQRRHHDGGTRGSPGAPAASH